jgi:hypothetical protein
MVIFYMNYEPHLPRTTPAHRPLTPLSHLTPLLPTASGLFCAMDAPQPFSFQSIPHSFHRHGGVPPSHPCACPQPLRNRRLAIHVPQMKSGPLCTILVQCKSFRNNTCKSLSKQTTLTSFGINTYEKHRGEGGVTVNASCWCLRWAGTYSRLGKQLGLREGQESKFKRTDDPKIWWIL